MLKIFNDRECFYQWDLDQKLIVNDDSVTEIHFCNKTDDCALVCRVYEQDGARLVDVPNILLQSDLRFKAYAYCNNCYTKQCEVFKVIARSKPADYVYTKTEVWNAEKEVRQAMEEALATGDFKGDKGDKGEKGDTYVLTNADKQEIAAIALALLPDAEEVNY